MDGGGKKNSREQREDKCRAVGSFSNGSFESKSLFGAANVRDTSELAVRVAGYVRDTDCWITNSLNGKLLRARKEYGARVAVLWAPSPDFEAYLSYRYGKLDGSFNGQVPASSVRDLDRKSKRLNSSH